jgi:hypothetical protein
MFPSHQKYMSLFLDWLNSPRFINTMVLVAFALLFLFHIYPIGLSDLYWHLNTGRWIWEHHALPSSDPFTYTLGNTVDDRQKLILQGYWLAQLFFFAVYSAFGMWGLVVLKALLFILLYWLVWRTLLKADVHPLLALTSILILPWLIYRYDALRPQVFSFIGVVLVYMLLNHVIALLRHDAVVKPKALFALPLIMLAWANLHPGFILGWVVILVLLAGVTIDQWRGKNKLSRSTLRHLLVWCGLALLASLINPLADFFLYMGAIQYPANTRFVDEYLPLIDFSRMYQQPLLLYGVLVLVLVTIVGMACHWRRVTPPQIFLFVGFLAAGFYAARYTIFLVLMALIIGVPHISALIELRIIRTRLLLFVLLLVGGMSGVGYLDYKRGAWKRGSIESSVVPERVVDFIQTRHPPAPLFNAYEYGGYLGWRLAPDYRMFIDPRGLDSLAQASYETAQSGRYQEVFEKYGVNSVVFYIFTPTIRTIPKVTYYLLMDSQWDLVYVDKLSVVLVRHTQNTLPIIDKAPLLNYLQRKLVGARN